MPARLNVSGFLVALGATWKGAIWGADGWGTNRRVKRSHGQLPYELVSLQTLL